MCINNLLPKINSITMPGLTSSSYRNRLRTLIRLDRFIKLLLKLSLLFNRKDSGEDTFISG